MGEDRIEMSQWERDRLKVMSVVLKGDRTQSEAARLLKLSVRQVRRIQQRLGREGDGGVIHKLRGRASNARIEAAYRLKVVQRYRSTYAGFGPTLAAEKLSEEDDLPVAVRTLREWLVKEGLWQRVRQREQYRSRRVRRSCLGEMVQADASEHDWLEGRGGRMVLVGMIDDATSKVLARFHPAETTEAYMDVLWRWLKKHGRPVEFYSDRDSIFRAEDALDDPTPTQFSRALGELGIGWIGAYSPQAKGRIERLWGTAQDRLVKELRLAKATTLEQANRVLEEKFLPWFNRRCTVKPASENDAHRAVHPSMNLAAILSLQEKRVVANDYTIRFGNRVYQLYKPVWAGERGGQVVIEQRLDGSMHIRFKQRYLTFGAIGGKKEEEQVGLGALPPNPRSLTEKRIPAVESVGASQAKSRVGEPARPTAVHSAARPSGRTAALPCHPGGKSCGSSKGAWRPGADHAWRKSFIRRSPRQADISIGRK